MHKALSLSLAPLFLQALSVNPKVLVGQGRQEEATLSSAGQGTVVLIHRVMTAARVGVWLQDLPNTQALSRDLSSLWRMAS